MIRRGSLTVWCDQETLAGWAARGRRDGARRRGRPRTYSDVAITGALTLQAVYHRPLRATVGLLRSVFMLLGCALPVPHYATLARRRRTLDVVLPTSALAGPLHLVVDATGLTVYGEGEWKVRQHGWSKHRTWLKVHVGVDEATGEVRVAGVSTPAVTDGQMLPDLLVAAAAPLAQVTGDGAYDTRACWAAVAARPERPRAVFPLRRQRARTRARRAGKPPARQRYRTRIEQHGNSAQPPLARDEHLRRLRRVGRRRWKQETGYHRRSLAETTVHRLKQLFGPRITAREFESQAQEVFIRLTALNRMTRLGRPEDGPVAAP